MDLYNLVISAKISKGGGGGGGGDVTVEELNVTSNGSYSASSGYAYSPVNVSVPGIVPSGTSAITANGIYDVTNFASASVSVPIPSGYIQPTGTSSITSNGIYDITSFASVDVNVSGGGGGSDAEDGIIARTISGAYENSRVTSIGVTAFQSCSALTTVNFPNVTSIGSSAFGSCTSLTTASFPNAISIYNYAFFKCTSLTTAYFPSATLISTSAFASCSSLTTASFPNAISIGQFAFASCSKLSAVYFLASSAASLINSNAFSNTPMSNSTYTGTFGSIYVPASLVGTYKSKATWSVYADRITSYVE